VFEYTRGRLHSNGALICQIVPVCSSKNLLNYVFLKFLQYRGVITEPVQTVEMAALLYLLSVYCADADSIGAIRYFKEETSPVIIRVQATDVVCPRGPY